MQTEIKNKVKKREKIAASAMLWMELKTMKFTRMRKVTLQKTMVM